MTTKAKVIVGLAAAAVLAVLVMQLRPRSADRGAARAPAANSQVLWQATCDYGTSPGAVLGPDGTIYVGGFNGMCAFSPDGQLKWKKQIAGNLYLAAGSDANIYLSSSWGFVFGVSPQGEVAWDPKYGLIGFGAPPAIGADGTVLYANEVSDLWAFRPGSSNTSLWSQETFREGVINARASLPGSARVGTPKNKNSPVIWRDETIALPRQHWLHLFNPDGSPAWLTELSSGQLGEAALADDGTIYVADDGYSFFAVNRSGDVAWQIQTDGSVLGSAVVGPDATIYLATRASVYARKPDGSVEWQVHPPQGCITSPVLMDDGTIYVGGNAGIFALRSDGSVKTNGQSTLGGAPTVAPDGTLYVACAGKGICALRGDGSHLAKSPWPMMYHDPAHSSRILTAY